MYQYWNNAGNVYDRFGSPIPNPQPTAMFRATTRYFKQPLENDYLIDPQNPPTQVFHPPFQIQVDPQITVEQYQLVGNTPQMLIGLPAAVHAIRPNPADPANPLDVPLYLGDRATNFASSIPTRFRQSDTIEWRYFYTQSQGNPPTVAEMHLLSVDPSSGNATPLHTYPSVLRTTGTQAMDPFYARYPDPALSASSYFGILFTRLTPTQNPDGSLTPSLAPGIYRYFFRASDGTRAVEWPGDSNADSTLVGVSHVANTLRINNPPSLDQNTATSAQVNGALTWTVGVRYTDLDNDAPNKPGWMR